MTFLYIENFKFKPCKEKYSCGYLKDCGNLWNVSNSIPKPPSRILPSIPLNILNTLEYACVCMRRHNKDIKYCLRIANSFGQSCDPPIPLPIQLPCISADNYDEEYHAWWKQHVYCEFAEMTVHPEDEWIVESFINTVECLLNKDDYETKNKQITQLDTD